MGDERRRGTCEEEWSEIAGWRLGRGERRSTKGRVIRGEKKTDSPSNREKARKCIKHEKGWWLFG